MHMNANVCNIYINVLMYTYLRDDKTFEQNKHSKCASIVSLLRLNSKFEKIMIIYIYAIIHFDLLCLIHSSTTIHLDINIKRYVVLGLYRGSCRHGLGRGHIRTEVAADTGLGVGTFVQR